MRILSRSAPRMSCSGKATIRHVAQPNAMPRVTCARLHSAAWSGEWAVSQKSAALRTSRHSVFRKQSPRKKGCER
jgi:hypothetical protein